VRRMGQSSSASMLPPAPFAAPRTSFNAALTSARSYAFTSLDLPTVKAVKHAVGCTVNDVVLGLCGGALRDYLADRGEVPDGALVAMVPVSVRSDDQRDAMGNKVSSMLTTLATDVDDPIDRLKVIHEVMVEAKELQKAIGADTLQEWSEFAAPALLGRAARLYSRMRWADSHRPLFNVTISNVPGPPFPLYSAGARLLANYPIGPIMEGGGLNMTVMSYLDQLDFGLLACPDVLDDVWALGDGLHAALAELVEATGVSDKDAAKFSRQS
jgi:diacylglycerol O-acyltransferase / wax synthase